MLDWIPLLYLFSALLLPTLLAKYLLAKINLDILRLEKLFFSFFLGQIVWVLLLFLTSLFLGLSKGTVLISLAPPLVACLYAFNRERKFLKPSFKLEKYEKIFLVTLLVFTLGFSILLKRHMMEEDVNGFSTPHNTFGDIQYHMAIVNSFYLGDNFPPENPIYPGTNLSYPFLIDYYSAVYRTLGFNLQISLIIPGLIFGISVFSLFLLFAYRFLGKASGSLIALLVFLFNGGMGGYLLLRDAIKEQNFLEAFAGNFSPMIDKYNFRFPNGVSSVFMAERPILVGLALFLLVIILLWTTFEKRKADKEMLLVGFAIGLLPLWHTHTIIALGLVLPFYFVAYWIHNKTTFAKTFRFFLPILYLSVPLGLIGMLWHLPQVFGGGVHFFSFKTWWIVGSEGVLTFWFRNLGIFIPLVLLAFVSLDKKQRIFYIPVFLIFIFANFINFQPFDWDNYKILLVWYMISSAVVANLLNFISKSGILGRTLSTLVLLFLVLSGLILAIGDSLTSYGLFSKEDIELSNWQVSNTNPRDLFLTGPQHNQFSILAGRKILMGYQGYLWTQGIDSGSREGEIKRMYQGDVALIKKYGIKYVVLGYKERESYQPDEKFLDKSFPVVKETQNFKIYKVI
jgi:hypothetical protein